MGKKTTKELRWRITRIKSTPAAELGTVHSAGCRDRYQESNRGMTD
jgi:hypothetical protein